MKLTDATLFAPLREPVFRSIWLASLLSNFGQLLQSVAAGWEMTRLSNSPGMVALVQTSAMLPMMLLSIPAGALADTFDKRKVALSGLCLSFLMAIALTAFASQGLLTPYALLGFSAMIGAGFALYGPAWQSSIAEQVRTEHLPAAVTLGSVSYNVARSFGPALGGLIVALTGAAIAFAVNAVLLIPIMIAFLAWKRGHIPSRLPPERVGRAVISGLRYVMHASSLRNAVLRTFASGIAAASLYALMPVIAQQKLAGGAEIYGLLLGAMGLGAMIGAAFMSRLQSLAPESGIRCCAVPIAAMIMLIGLSTALWLTLAALVVAGGFWMLLIARFNIFMQLSSPRWVTGRAMAAFQSSITGGLALGSWLWGMVAAHWGLETALVASGGAVALTLLLGPVLSMPAAQEDISAVGYTHEPDLNLAVTDRSGPISIEIFYRVDPADARAFYHAVQEVRSARMRTGGFGWSVARDLKEPEIWVERYYCPTWGDYLRQRSRATEMERQAHMRVEAFHRGDVEQRVRRWLERPVGSVRWRAEVPDSGGDVFGVLNP